MLFLLYIYILLNIFVCSVVSQTASVTRSASSSRSSSRSRPCTTLLPGFYRNGQLCLPCHYSCVLCTGPSASSCVKCDSANHRTNLTTVDYCPCDPGFVDVGIAMCAQNSTKSASLSMTVSQSRSVSVSNSHAFSGTASISVTQSMRSSTTTSASTTTSSNTASYIISASGDTSVSPSSSTSLSTSRSPTQSMKASIPASMPVTESSSRSASPTLSLTRTTTITASPSLTQRLTASHSATQSRSPSHSASPPRSLSHSATQSRSPSHTRSPSASFTSNNFLPYVMNSSLVLSTTNGKQWLAPPGGCLVTVNISGGGGGGPGSKAGDTSAGGDAATFFVTFWSDGVTYFTAQSGTGGQTCAVNDYCGGGGGGGSAIFTKTSTIAVAGGGGGGGGAQNAAYFGLNGAIAGLPGGSAASAIGALSYCSGGRGGSQTVGGAPGTGSGSVLPPTAGSFAKGGNGGGCTATGGISGGAGWAVGGQSNPGSSCNGGGGGGGWYGGGGGAVSSLTSASCGGGGGSSWVNLSWPSLSYVNSTLSGGGISRNTGNDGRVTLVSCIITSTPSVSPSLPSSGSTSPSASSSKRRTSSASGSYSLSRTQTRAAPSVSISRSPSPSSSVRSTPSSNMNGLFSTSVSASPSGSASASRSQSQSPSASTLGATASPTPSIRPSFSSSGTDTSLTASTTHVISASVTISQSASASRIVAVTPTRTASRFASSPTSAAPWPHSFGGNSQHTGASSYAGPSNLSAIAWTYSTGSSTAGGASSGIAVGYDGAVIVTTNGPYVFSLNGFTGAVNWQTFIGSGCCSGPVISSGDSTVYVGANGLFALDFSTGRILYTLGGLFSTRPAVIDVYGNIYVAQNDGNGTLYAFSPNRTLLWSYKTYVQWDCPSLSPDGTLVYIASNIGASGNRMYCFNASRGGALAWSINFPSYGDSPPAINANGVLFKPGQYAGYTYAYDGQTGATLWSWYTGGVAAVTPALDPRGSFLYTTPWGTTNYMALKQLTGTPLWSGTSQGSNPSNSLLDSRGVLFAPNDNYLLAINSTSGIILSSLPYPRLSRPALGSNGILYLIDYSGVVWALGSSVTTSVTTSTESATASMTPPSPQATLSYAVSPPTASQTATASPSAQVSPLPYASLLALPLPYCPTLPSSVSLTSLPGCPDVDSSSLETPGQAGGNATSAWSSPAAAAAGWCACAPGAFFDLGSGGACHACPPLPSGFDGVLPILRLFFYVILGFSAIALVTAVVLLAAGARVFEGVARTLSLVATLFAMLQVIAQTGSAVGACLPNYLRRALAVVAPLVLNSIAFTPAPCLMTADGAQGNLFQLFGSQIATFYLAGVLVLVLTLSDIAGRLRRACLSRRIFRGGCNLVAPSTIGKAAGLLILTVQPIALSSAVTLLDCTTVLLPAASAMQLQIWNSGNIMNNSTFSAVTENNNSSSVSSNNSSFVAVTVLRTQPFVICFSPVHAGAAVGAIATLAVLALALPIALYFALVSARYRVLGARSALLSGSLELHHDAEDGGGVKTSNPMASKSRKNSARTVTRPPQQLRAQLGALYATARLDDEKAQAAWVRGDAPMQRRGRCTALQRSCPVRAVRRARVALCCVGRDALSRAHALPPPQPKPYSIAALLARYAPAVHRAIFSPAALPPVTALSVADLALRPRLLVADAAQSAARPGLAAALAELTPAARAAAAAHRADLTSAERLLLSGDYRPSLASLAIADYLAATIIVIVAAALPIFSPDPSRAGLRAGLTVAVCAALGWALAEQKPYVGAAAWKLALRELTLVIYAGCSVLALFCSSCTPDSDALLIVAGITLALMLLVPLIACGALTSNAKQEIEAEDKAPLHSVASEGEVAGNSSVRGSFRAAAPPPPPPPPPPRLLSLQRNTSIGRMPTHRSLHNLPLAGAADGPANEPRRLIAASTPTRISWRNLPVSLRAGGGIRVLQPPPVAASTDMLRAAQPIIVRIASSSDIDSRAGSTRRVAALHVDTGVLIHDKPMRASSRAVFTPQAGRMEGPTRFATTIMRSGTGVAVDLAHTPDALIKPDVLADIAHRRQSMRHMLRN